MDWQFTEEGGKYNSLFDSVKDKVSGYVVTVRCLWSH
ncbi:hypothetical protein CM15mP43_06110 [bacterium]|nr:MAG: hypothetical protein CM15mP43_06110 [bacterium]